MHWVARQVVKLPGAVAGAALLMALLMLPACPVQADVRSEQLAVEAWNTLQRQAWPEAQARFKRALASDPRDAMSWTGLGYALVGQAQYADALAAFERANQLAPSAYAWAGVGHACMMLATRYYVPIDRRQALLEHSGAAFAEAQARQPGVLGVLGGMLLLSIFASQPGAPPLSLAVVAGLALLVLFVAGARRVARMPRATLRAEARALLSAVIVPYVFTRAVVLGAFWLAPLWLERRITFNVTMLAGTHNPILEAAAERWDSNLYVAVALLGYQPEPLSQGGWGLLGQLPLLPVLYRMTMQLLGDAYWSALVLPHVALLLATFAMYFAVRDSDGDTMARRATWVLLLVPGALFGSALYAEPIALAGIIAAYAHARRDRVATSIVSGMLAGMARINALAAVPMLALAGLTRARAGSRAGLLTALGPALGLSVFMLYTHFEFGDAFAYFNELRQHRFTNQGPAPALSDVGLLLDAARQGKHWRNVDHNAIGFFAIACLLTYAWAGFDLFRRARYAEASFVLTGVLLAIGSNLISAPRYLWLLFPAYISFAHLGDKPLPRRIAFVLLIGLMFVQASGFSQFYFVL